MPLTWVPGGTQPDPGGPGQGASTGGLPPHTSPLLTRELAATSLAAAASQMFILVSFSERGRKRKAMGGEGKRRKIQVFHLKASSPY